MAEVIKKKSTARAKRKATSQEELIYLWKQHFKNLFLKVTDEPITKIISNQLDIKHRQFTQEELDLVLRKSFNTKGTGPDEISP